MISLHNGVSKMKKIAILQSNYIPWKGVFDMIHQVDEFVFLETVQYTRRDWRNRNKIKTDRGEQWLTIPIENKGRFQQTIFETKICQNTDWQEKHFNQFVLHYSKAAYFNEYKWILEELYKARQWNLLSEFNIYGIKLIAEVLHINTAFSNSLELDCSGTKDDLLCAICEKLKADVYLSGPSAKNYIIPEKFEDRNIQLDYVSYSYPEYTQVYENFTHNVTILDLIFNCGPDSPYYTWGFKQDQNSQPR